MSIEARAYTVCTLGCRTGEDCDGSCVPGKDTGPTKEERLRELIREVARDEFARLSPAPVGGECQTPLAACMDHCDCSVTPPPAEPDGGDARRLQQIDYSIDLQRIIEDLCHGRCIRPPATGALHHYEMATQYQGSLTAAGRERADRIADLEQRLAEARRVAAHNAARAKESDEIADNAHATIAERDRRIAALEAGLKLAMDDVNDDVVAKQIAALSPATDKGGE